MIWFLGSLIFVSLLVFIVSLSMRVLIKDTSISKCSKYTINMFEPDNTAPKLTDMIEYHRTHEKTRYCIGE